MSSVEKNLNQEISLEKQLVKVCGLGNLAQVKQLVEKQNIDVHFNEDLPLREACLYGHLEVVKYLIKQGANIYTLRDRPLRLASIHGYPDIVKYLIDKGVNVHIYSDIPLRYANSCHNEHLVKYILSLKPKMYWLTHFRKDVRKIYKKYINEL